MFTVGEQKQIDDWFKQIGNTGENDGLAKLLVTGWVRTESGRGTGKKLGKMTLGSAPKAIPPTLTVFVQNPLVESEQLQLPEDMDVAIGHVPAACHSTIEQDCRRSAKQAGSSELPKTNIGDSRFLTRMQIEKFLEQRK